MATIHLTGRITATGELEAKLPEGLPPGEVEISIELPDSELPWDLRPWTKEELDDMMKFEPATGAEIVASDSFGAWADEGITDSVAWVEEVRRKEQERHNW